MMKATLSPSALGLLRTLISRCEVARDRILLTDWRSTDWQSLTFGGERHELQIRIVGPDSIEVARRLSAGLEDAELTIPGHIVADIALTRGPLRSDDGSTVLGIEALTIVD
jgi:hypothetical protein